MSKRLIDSDYYIQTWHFNPRDYQIPLGDNPNYFRYQQDFPLLNDPVFSEAGLVLSARVEVMDEDITNYIVIKDNTNEIAIKCRHTIIFQGSWNEIQQIGIEKFQESLLNKFDDIFPINSSTPNHTNFKRTLRPSVELSPEEHFVALRIYVDQVSKLNFCTEFERTFQDGPKAFPLRKKLLAGLIQIAPTIVEKVAKSIFQSWGFIPNYLLEEHKEDVFESIRSFLTDNSDKQENLEGI